MTTASTAARISYTPYGGALELFRCRDREVIMDGPAGTGKSFAALQKLHLILLKYPRTTALLLRKTLVSLKATTLQTYRNHVLHPLDGVRFWSAKGEEPAHYAYPNGSKLVIGGMDKPAKVMSSAYDIILYDEATDGDLDEWEALTTRINRPGSESNIPYNQIIGCVNPQSPHHWLNQRMNDSRTTRLLSRHEDNPTITETYLETLRALTGVRRARLYSGEWRAADGMIYEDAWDARRNLINRFQIPAEWPRYLSIDFGFTNPFVCQWWAEDGDGRLYRYREIYRTRRLVEDHARDIVRLSGWDLDSKHPLREPLPRAIVCDHDAEDRATLERHLMAAGRRLVTTAAQKAVSDGIQVMAGLLRPAGDGKPRMLFLRDSLAERDPYLVEHKLPTCTEEEIEGYVWQDNKEKPVKENDHGMDPARYMAMHRYGKNRSVTYTQSIWR